MSEKPYQVVLWWPRITIEWNWQGFGLARLHSHDPLRTIYEWFLRLGFLEIRKWTPEQDKPRLMKEYHEHWHSDDG